MIQPPALAAALLLTTAVAAGGQENGIFPYPVRTETLANGLTVVLVPTPAEGLVSFWSVVRTGSRDEYEPGHSGFAHFFEHMMFRGTEAVPAQVYNDRVTAMGADNNAFTSSDFTAYYLTVAAADLDAVMALESDRFQNLAYAEKEFETEAGAVYGEYRKGRTNPVFVLYEAIRKTAFTTHTYGHTTIGFEADIQAMPTMYDYSRSFFSRYYRPENTVLLIVGDLEEEPTLELVRKHYDGWERGYVSPRVPEEPQQQEPRRVEVDYPGRSLPMLWVAYKADRFDPDNRRRAALDLLAYLAFGEASDLYRRLVLEEQVVQTLQLQTTASRDPGLLDVLLQVKDEARLDDVLAAVDETVERYRSTPPDPERLAELKSRLKYRFLMLLDTPYDVASALAPYVAVTGGVEAAERLFATYETITPEEVQQAARAYLVPERRTLGILRGEGS